MGRKRKTRSRRRKATALHLALTRNGLLAMIPFEEGQPLAHLIEHYHRRPHLVLRLLVNTHPILL